MTRELDGEREVGEEVDQVAFGVVESRLMERRLRGGSRDGSVGRRLDDDGRSIKERRRSQPFQHDCSGGLCPDVDDNLTDHGRSCAVWSPPVLRRPGQDIRIHVLGRCLNRERQGSDREPCPKERISRDRVYESDLPKACPSREVRAIEEDAVLVIMTLDPNGDGIEEGPNAEGTVAR